MYCWNCGQDLPPNSTHCFNCGMPQNEDDLDQEQGYDERGYRSRDDLQPYDLEEGRVRSPLLPILIASLAGVLLLAVGVYFLVTSKACARDEDRPNFSNLTLPDAQGDFEGVITFATSELDTIAPETFPTENPFNPPTLPAYDYWEPAPTPRPTPIVVQETPTPSPVPPQPTDPPPVPTDPPPTSIDPPTEPTDPPTEPTEVPTEPPTKPTEAPTEPTEAPTEPTEAPTEPPTEPPTEAPTEPTEAPEPPDPAQGHVLELADISGRGNQRIPLSFALRDENGERVPLNPAYLRVYESVDGENFEEQSLDETYGNDAVVVVADTTSFFMTDYGSQVIGELYAFLSGLKLEADRPDRMGLWATGGGASQLHGLSDDAASLQSAISGLSGGGESRHAYDGLLSAVYALEDQGANRVVMGFFSGPDTDSSATADSVLAAALANEVELVIIHVGADDLGDLANLPGATGGALITLGSASGLGGSMDGAMPDVDPSRLLHYTSTNGDSTRVVRVVYDDDDIRVVSEITYTP